MADKINPIRETNQEALDIAAKLVSKNKYAVLGTLEPGTGTPLVSRVAFARLPGGGLFFLASDLSHHSKCLLEDARCSLLVGEPGKGDGLAHPRITLLGKSGRLANDNPDRGGFRDCFLADHPKAELYIDFADFGFYPVRVERALLNAGFGKAFVLEDNHLDFLRAG